MALITLQDGFDFVKVPIPLRFKIGQTIIIEMQVTDGYGVPANILGRTYTFKLGPDGGSSILTIAGVITDNINGMLKFTSGSTSGLSAGNYQWEVWENTDNFLCGGPVEITSKRVI